MGEAFCTWSIASCVVAARRIVGRRVHLASLGLRPAASCPIPRPRRSVRVYKHRVVVDVNRLELFLREFETRRIDLFAGMADSLVESATDTNPEFSERDYIDVDLATELLFDLFEAELPDGRPGGLPADDYDPNDGTLTIHAPELPPHLDPPRAGDRSARYVSGAPATVKRA